MDKQLTKEQTVNTLLAAVSTLQAACVDAVEHGEISDVNSAKAWIRQQAYQLLLLRQFILVMHNFQVPWSLAPQQLQSPPETIEAPTTEVVVKRKRKPKTIRAARNPHRRKLTVSRSAKVK